MSSDNSLVQALFWLVFGATAIGAVALGVVSFVGGDRLGRTKRARLRRWAVYLASIAILVLVLGSVDWERVGEAFFDPEIFREQFPEIITTAAKNTLIYTFLAFAFGLAFGLLLALMRLSPVGPYRWAATVYIEIFRGLPALVTIILIGFVLPLALDLRLPNVYLQAMVALGIVAAAYMAETIRAGIQAVPPGQVEAARSLGMSQGWAMTAIVIPQALRIILPPLTNEFVLLLKDTSLVFVLGTTPQTIELTKWGRDGVSETFNGTPLIAAAIMYLVITIPLTRVVAWMETRTSQGTR